MKQNSTPTSDSVKSNDFMETIQINRNNISDEEYETLCRIINKSKSNFKETTPIMLTPLYAISLPRQNLATIPMGSSNSEILYKAGFLHTSPSEAKKSFDTRYVLGRLAYLSKNSAEPYNPWDGKSRHYFIGYLPDEDRLIVSSTVSMKTGIPYFASEDAAREAIYIIGESILKTCLNNI